MLHILVGGSCNNNCIFCMEEGRDWRSETGGAHDRSVVRRMISEYPDTSEILFTRGEPTLCPDLPLYIT